MTKRDPVRETTLREVQALLKQARPDQIRRLLHDIYASGSAEEGAEAR
ncbi:hypothetical protein ACQ5SP_01340 [Rhodovulum sp. YNF3179]